MKEKKNLSWDQASIEDFSKEGAIKLRSEG